jgi:hypothetical protein
MAEPRRQGPDRRGNNQIPPQDMANEGGRGQQPPPQDQPQLQHQQQQPNLNLNNLFLDWKK